MLQNSVMRDLATPALKKRSVSAMYLRSKTGALAQCACARKAER
jgi:hypothetical protein